MLFNIPDKEQLSKLLAVAPGEIDYVLSRLPRYYRPQKILKPDGTPRMLLVPCGKLKALQKKIKDHILDEFEWLPCVHGGIKRRSILSNTKPHVGQDIVFSVDVQDFFPSVKPDRVFRIFSGLGFGEKAARILTCVTTWNYQLPQGASTSTGIANLSLIIVDVRIQRLAELHGLAYTRFIDDLTVSGHGRLVKLRALIQRILQSEGFTIKPQKTVTMHWGTRQTVTKLVVNEKVNIVREKRNEIREEILSSSFRTGGDSIASLAGRVQWVRYVNPTVGDNLSARLQRKAAH